MDRKPISARIALFAAILGGTAVTFGHAQAASEQTRRTTNAIQNYQSRQQTPYYSGQSNPYYGRPPQAAQGNPVPPPPPDNSLPNRVRQIENNRNGQ